MDLSRFITIGENIHCTRVVLAGGKHTVDLPGGGQAVAFGYEGENRTLPIPADWEAISPAYGNGQIKHMALAIHQATRGKGEARQAGEDYLVWAARQQIETGADFLDLNVDEYSNDPAVQAETMRWLAGFLSERFDARMSIDSSRVETLVAGLEACRKDVASPLVNSVSLERTEAIEVLRPFNAEAVVSAAGKNEIPNTLEGRMAHFEKIVALLDRTGMARPQMHLDPLVLPISTDPANGKAFLDAVAETKRRFEGVHVTGGFSNVSFGMPRRNLLNRVFLWLCVNAGADSGILNPVVLPPRAIAEMDTQEQAFRLASAFLTGEDPYGMEFISAHRDGRLD
jgi:5-methyltetrahydrofolate--homocysteine methyltransferase